MECALYDVRMLGLRAVRSDGDFLFDSGCRRLVVAEVCWLQQRQQFSPPKRGGINLLQQFLCFVVHGPRSRNGKNRVLPTFW